MNVILTKTLPDKAIKAVNEDLHLVQPIEFQRTKVAEAVSDVLEGKLELNKNDIDALGAMDFLTLARIFTKAQRSVAGVVIGEQANPVELAIAA